MELDPSVDSNIEWVLPVDVNPKVDLNVDWIQMTDIDLKGDAVDLNPDDIDLPNNLHYDVDPTGDVESKGRYV